MNKTPIVYQIHLSNGGVPKHAVPFGEVGPEGVRGDRQRDRRYHGGPERALCLYALELIEALQREGHPIVPGSIGENILLAGIDFAGLRPGNRLQLGEELLLEITTYAAPCTTIRASFTGEDFSRISHRLHPGWSRLYARVITSGTVHIGDRVMLPT